MSRYYKNQKREQYEYQGVPIQNALFAVLGVLGIILANTIIFAPIHESSHAEHFRLRGIEAEITAWNITTVRGIDRSELTIAALLSGYMGEYLAFWLITLAGIGLTNVRYKSIRNNYCLLGLPWGYMLGLIFTAPNGSDFLLNSAYTASMSSLWYGFTIIMFICISWLILVGRILK